MPGPSPGAPRRPQPRSAPAAADFLYAQPERGYGLNGSSALPNLRDVHDRRLMLAVTILVIALAVVNTITFTWTTAMEARATMAITRTLGATPGQISAGLSTAQLLPALPGAIVGILLGLGLCSMFALGKWTVPPSFWLLGAALATLLATAALTALPARLAARRPVAQARGADPQCRNSVIGPAQQASATAVLSRPRPA
ncbi:FtsX-like permease family protein [Microtetraspora fusca]|uniref:FtsX-like permease family protein n=1 Tax=Microtetraspora fusca TaxID=1997 RepID=A0ABW6V718_MICFU